MKTITCGECQFFNKAVEREDEKTRQGVISKRKCKPTGNWVKSDTNASKCTEFELAKYVVCVRIQNWIHTDVCIHRKQKGYVAECNGCGYAALLKKAKIRTAQITGNIESVKRVERRMPRKINATGASGS